MVRLYVSTERLGNPREPGPLEELITMAMGGPAYQARHFELRWTAPARERAPRIPGDDRDFPSNIFDRSTMSHATSLFERGIISAKTLRDMHGF